MGREYQYRGQIVLAFAISAIKILNLVLWVEPAARYSLATTSVAIAGSILLPLVVLVECHGPKRSRTFLSGYLIVQILADSWALRTVERNHHTLTFVGASWASIFMQLALLVFESTSKRAHLTSSAGVSDRSTTWWLNQLFWKGSDTIPTQSDLFPLDNKIESARLRDRVVLAWDENKTRKNSVLLTILSSILVPFVQILPPRAVRIALNYGQISLIAATVNYLETLVAHRSLSYSCGLIGATALIHIGMVVADAILHEKRNRLLVTFRGSLISLIYDQAFLYPSVADDLPAITLMSADVDQMSNAILYASEIWALLVELGVGIALLWRQIGLVALAPVVLTGIAAGINTLLAKVQGKRRGVWLAAMQKRVGLTSKILGSMKSVKLGGMSKSTAKRLQAERVHELEKANSSRWFTILQNTVASAPVAIAGLLVFATYTIRAKTGYGETLTTAKAYTTLSLISTLSQPSSMLLQTISALFSVSANIKRLEEYLKKVEKRNSCHPTTEKSEKGDGAAYIITIDNAQLDVSIGSSKMLIDLNIMRHTTTMISGPVGSGKSTLLLMLLGERAPSSGSMTNRASSVGFCSANPWLRNETIQENIVNNQVFNDEWYHTIVSVCDLNTDLALLPRGNDTPIGSRGNTLSGGQKHRIALARALYSRCSLLLLDETFDALDYQTRQNVLDRLLKHIKQYRLTLVFISHDTNLAQFTDQVLVLNPDTSTATLEASGSWVGMKRSNLQSADSSRSEAISPDPPFEDEKTRTQDKSRKTDDKTKLQIGNAAVWRYYIKSVGLGHSMLLLFFTTVAVSAENFPRLLLRELHLPKTSFGAFIGIYALAAVLEIAGVLAMLWESMVKIASTSSVHLHQMLVTTTFNAPMSYLSSVDNSVTLNRFSQDMMLIETTLPVMTYVLLQSFITCTVQLFLVTVGSSYMAVVIPPLVVVLYFLQAYYLRISRHIRSLDLDAKSPLYQQFTETLEGITTIRAFGMQEWLQRKFWTRLDESQKPYYLLLSLHRWLAIVMNIIVGATDVLLVTLACTSRTSNAGNLGVALTTVLVMGSQLQQLIAAWTQAGTSISSVARIQEFVSTTPNENSSIAEHQVDLHQNWPVGSLELDGLTVKYNEGEDEHYALQDVSFAIKAGQRLGICGRTGSGKSTLVSVLLRLVDPSSGHASIGGVDISTLPREVVRSKIICLPQDPLLLPGTFEANLDVDGLATSTEMRSALEAVQLWDLVSERGGLEAEFQPDSLSSGEKQLLAMARAVLRNRQARGRSLLVLDEATSNLDSKTEALIQDVVRKEFRGQTIVSVAHRLETLRDCDTVVELDKGKTVRIGPAVMILG